MDTSELTPVIADSTVTSEIPAAPSSAAEISLEAFYSHYEALIILDRHGNILLHNPNAAALWSSFGVPLLQSLTFNENLEAAAAIQEGHETNAAQALLDAMQEQGRIPSPFLLTLPDDSIHEFSTNAFGDGCYIVIGRNVTERERSKARLQQSEHRYRLLVENITEGLVILDQWHRIIYANPRFLKLYGGTEDSILNKTLPDLIPTEARDMAVSFLTEESSASQDVPFICHDGSIRFVLISSTPLITASGEKNGNFATITDVTALRRASELQKQSEIRYRNIIEHTPFGILTLDINGQILSANPAFCKMIDSGTHAIALSAAQEWLPEMSPSLPEMMAQLDKKNSNGDTDSEPETTVTSYSRVRSPNNKLGHARLVLSRIGNIGECYLMIVKDISERQAMKEALQHASKLALLGEMSASMAHEISQPLNIIRLAAENALSTMDEANTKASDIQTAGLDQAIRQTFETISDQSRRLRATVNHMQAFSRRDTGPQRSFDILKTIQDALMMLHPRCMALGINVTQYLPDYDPSNPIAAMGHPRHMEQVLLNLINNAADSIVERRLNTPNETDEILISAKLKQQPGPEGATPRELMVIEVSDSGTGIRPEDMTHLFDPFFTRKTEGSGTGLGLSISLGLMGNMGGNIVAENRPEGGCRFSVTIPTTQEPCPEEPQPQPRPLQQDAELKPSSGLTILLVDDELLVLREMANYLTRSGHKIIPASGGNVAKRQLQITHVDVVITDLQMPDGDGYNLIDHINAEYPHVGIIVTTGQPLRERMAANEQNSGIDVLLQKPISLQELSETLENFKHG